MVLADVSGRAFRLGLVCFVTALLTVVRAQVAVGPWPKFHADAFNDGQGASAGATNAAKWKAVVTNGAIHSSPAVGPDGTIYVGSDDRFLYAINGTSGSVVWAFEAGAPIRSSPAIGSIENTNLIYVGAEDYNVYAIDSTTGHAAWTFTTLGKVDSSPAFSGTGIVYVGSDDGNVYALNGQSGAEIWHYLTGGPVTASPAVMTNGNVFVGSTDGTMYALNGLTGAVVWSFATGGPISCSAAIDAQGNVCVGSDDGTLRAFNYATGAVGWTYPTGSPIRTCPAIFNGSVYFGTLNDIFYSISASGGNASVNWTFATGGEIDSSPALASDGSVYFGSFDKKIYCLNGLTGALNWTNETNNPVEASPAVAADGSLYIGSDDDLLYAFKSNGSAKISSLSLNPNTVVATHSSTATVTISNPAPTGGADVVLASGAAAATVPAGLTIAGGTTSATFTVKTTTVAQPTTASITATYNGSTGTAPLTINPGNLVSLTLSPTDVIGGNLSTATVTIDGLAPAGGLSVVLSGAGPDSTLPNTVAIAAGVDSATFTINSIAVASQTSSLISATLNGTTRQATLTIEAPTVSSVTFNPPAVAAGVSATGTITLTGVPPTGGAFIALASANPSAATVPTAITIAVGQLTGTFPVTTKSVSAPTSVVITATYGFAQATGSLNITTLALVSVGVSPARVAGGNSSAGTVTLNGPARAGGVTVSLSSGNHAAIVPASLKIAQGQTSATFAVKTVAVGAQTAVTIGAKAGAVAVNCVLSIEPPSLQSISLNPGTVTGGSPSTGTITLNGQAPTGGLGVMIASSQSAASVPTMVKIAAGKASGTFTVKTSAVGAQVSATISASLNGLSEKAALTILPPALKSFTVSPSTVSSGKSAKGTVTITAAAPAGGLVISISSNAGAVDPPGSVAIPAGKTSATFSIATTKVSSKTSVTISASAGGVTKTALLTVT